MLFIRALLSLVYHSPKVRVFCFDFSALKCLIIFKIFCFDLCFYLSFEVKLGAQNISFEVLV